MTPPIPDEVEREDDGSVWNEDVWMESCKQMGGSIDWAAIDRDIDALEAAISGKEE